MRTKKKLYVKMSSTIYTHWYIYGNVMILIQSGAGNRLRYIDWLHWIEDWCDFADFDMCIYRDIYLNRPNIDGLVQNMEYGACLCLCVFLG